MKTFEGMNTYIGIFIAVLPTIAGMLGYHTTPMFDEQASALIADGITLLGALYAFYGRARATVPGFLAKD